MSSQRSAEVSPAEEVPSSAPMSPEEEWRAHRSKYMIFEVMKVISITEIHEDARANNPNPSDGDEERPAKKSRPNRRQLWNARRMLLLKTALRNQAKEAERRRQRLEAEERRQRLEAEERRQRLEAEARGRREAEERRRRRAEGAAGGGAGPRARSLAYGLRMALHLLTILAVLCFLVVFFLRKFHPSLVVRSEATDST